MALNSYKEDKTLGKTNCTTDQESWRCPNMLSIGECSIGRFEYYRCSQCGKRETIDWDECK